MRKKRRGDIGKLKKKGKEINLTDKKQIAEGWKRYAKAIRPDLEEIDRFQAESVGRSFTKVVRI